MDSLQARNRSPARLLSIWAEVVAFAAASSAAGCAIADDDDDDTDEPAAKGDSGSAAVGEIQFHCNRRRWLEGDSPRDRNFLSQRKGRMTGISGVDGSTDQLEGV